MFFLKESREGREMKSVSLSLPFSRRNITQVEAIVLSCADHRFWHLFRYFTEEGLDLHEYFPISLGGIAKILAELVNCSDDELRSNLILKNALALFGHHPEIGVVAIGGHGDCLTYGGRNGALFSGSAVEEKERHLSDVRKARRVLGRIFPATVKVVGFYLELSEDREMVSFSLVEA